MINALLLASMPMVLMDSGAPELDRWMLIEAEVQAALECRELLSPRVLQHMPPSTPGRWTLTPARSFTVIGLPVARVELFIDSKAGEATYVAVIEKRSLEQVRKQLLLTWQGELLGQLAVVQPDQNPEITCTVSVSE